MKFVHCADCHIDGFRDSTLAQLGFKNFVYVVDFALQEGVDFLLIAGDLFNSALPRIDALKDTIAQLKRLKEKDIPVYFIPGSHDFSPQGRTMLEVIELAGLGTNVMKGKVNARGLLELTTTVDKKTGAQLVGMYGKRGMLDRKEYENLAPISIDKTKPSIFLFHTLINELKTKEIENIEGSNIDILPGGFDYYAGGHIHIRKSFSNLNYQHVVYPGPTFPNSFFELESLGGGSFVFYDSKQDFSKEAGSSPSPFKHVTIPGKEVVFLPINAGNKPAHLVQEETLDLLNNTDLDGKIVLLRFEGQLSEGKTHDIDFKLILQTAYEQGAFTVLKNSHKLSSTTFTEVKTTSEDAQKLEEETIAQHIGQLSLPEGLDEKRIIDELLQALDVEQFDGEKKTVFVERIQDTAKSIVENK